MHDAPGKQVSTRTTSGVGCEGSSCVASFVHANEWILWGSGESKIFKSVFLRPQLVSCSVLSGCALLLLQNFLNTAVWA